MMKSLRFLAGGVLLGSSAALAVRRARKTSERFVERIEDPAIPGRRDRDAKQPESEAAGSRPRPSYARKTGVALALVGLLVAGFAAAAYASNWHPHDIWGHQSSHRQPWTRTSTTDTSLTSTTTDSMPSDSTTSDSTPSDSTTAGAITTGRTRTDSTTQTTTVPVTTTQTQTQTTPTETSSTATTSVPAVPASYPLHTGIAAAVFWVGEPKGNGSSEDNSVSAYDDSWETHFGGYDNYAITRVAPTYDNGIGFVPRENPFYLDLPFDDVNYQTAFRDRCQVVPWASEYPAGDCSNQDFSYMKNRWVEVQHTVSGITYTAYAQIEDAGPYVYDDEAYVFGANDARPASQQANNAGLDVSPAVRDYLHFGGTDAQDQLNNDENKVNWRFVNADQVPAGPWGSIVTTQQVYQP
jgi:hypothetical protein